MKKKSFQTPSVCLFETRFSEMAILWSEFKDRPTISCILIPKPGMSVGQHMLGHPAGLTRGSCIEIDRVVNQIKSYLSGDDIRFSLNSVRMDLCTPFQEDVLRAEYAIPRLKFYDDRKQKEIEIRKAIEEGRKIYDDGVGEL